MKVFKLSLLVGLLLASFSISANAQRRGELTGYLDGIRYYDGVAHVVGWACSTGNSDSVRVVVQIGTGHDSLVISGLAIDQSEDAVNRACQSRHGNFRFRFPLNRIETRELRGERIYAKIRYGRRGAHQLTNSGDRYVH